MKPPVPTGFITLLAFVLHVSVSIAAMDFTRSLCSIHYPSDDHIDGRHRCAILCCALNSEHSSKIEEV